MGPPGPCLDADEIDNGLGHEIFSRAAIAANAQDKSYSRTAVLSHSIPTSPTIPMPGPDKQERIEELLRKSLLGEELINTQFHLFSARSLPSGRVLKPRVLCANNVLLAKSSRYFLDCTSFLYKGRTLRS